MQELPTLTDMCVSTAKAIIEAVAGIEMPKNDPEVVSLIEDLRQEFIEKYALDGMPYGETEQDLVRYLMDTLVISVEEEE